MLQKNNKKLVERAKNYPFEIPDNSYVLINGNPLKLKKYDYGNILNCVIIKNGNEIKVNEYLEKENINKSLNIVTRYPVLGFGSNSSPTQLSHKFSDLSRNEIIPAVKAQLHDFDVVYSAHFSPYGSIPATLQYSPDTIVNVFVTFLTYSQILQMNKTESIGVNYSLGKLSNIKLILEGGAILHDIRAYISLRGCLFINNSNISLEKVSAQRRKFPQMNEIEVLEYVKKSLSQDKDLDLFILENIKNPEIREERNSYLKQISTKFSFEDFEILEC